MENIAALIASVFTFASSFVFAPQHAVSNVLGDSTDESVVEEVVTEIPTEKELFADPDSVEELFMQFNIDSSGMADSGLGEEVLDPELVSEEVWGETLELQNSFEEIFMTAFDSAETVARQADAQTTSRAMQMADTRRRRVVTDTCSRFNTLNRRVSAMAAERVNRLQGLMGKIESRAAFMAANGNDVSGCVNTIDNARGAVSMAQQQVLGNVGSVYQCASPTDEGVLEDSVMEANSLFGENVEDTEAVMEQVHTGVELSFACIDGVDVGSQRSNPSQIPAATARPSTAASSAPSRAPATTRPSSRASSNPGQSGR